MHLSPHLGARPQSSRLYLSITGDFCVPWTCAPNIRLRTLPIPRQYSLFQPRTTIKMPTVRFILPLGAPLPIPLYSPLVTRNNSTGLVMRPEIGARYCRKSSNLILSPPFLDHLNIDLSARRTSPCIGGREKCPTSPWRGFRSRDADFGLGGFGFGTNVCDYYWCGFHPEEIRT